MREKTFTDQLKRSVAIPSPLNRIISLVPSQTELLCDSGLEENLVGVTKFCVHPQHIKKEKQIIGGTKNLRFEVIKKLQPDLIIANKEENNKADIQQLEKDYNVWVSDVKNYNDAFEMIKQIGNITNKNDQSKKIIEEIEKEKNNFEEARLSKTSSSIYLIWKDPYMTVGGDTFISNMMELAGFKNLYQSELRYPEITIENMQQQNPDVIFLSSEPYPFQQKHIEGLKTHLPQTKIILVDGEMFSWYGSRLKYCFEYFDSLKSC